MLLLTEEDVARCFTLRDAMEALEEAMRHQSAGGAVNSPRYQALSLPGLALRLMPGAVLPWGVAGFKVLLTFAVAHHGYYILLFDTREGRALALLQGETLGHLRTGAVSAVAARYMALPGASVAGVLGSGRQARSQLQAICAVLPLREARVYSPNREHREAYAREMSARLGFPVTAAGTGEEAVRGSQVVVCATSSLTPVLRGEWLSPGAFVVGMGAYRADMQEVDEETVVRARTVVVDSIPQAKLESGDLLRPIEKGLLRWEQVVELHQVVSGQAPGRLSPEDITFFKSLGIGLWDVATAYQAYRKATAMGLGASVDL